MKFNIKFSLIIFMFLIISLGAVSAAEIEQTDDVSLNPISNEAYTVTQDNYNTYFDSQGNLLSNVNDGDTLKLSGNFENKNFKINKNITIVGDNVLIKQGTVSLISGSSGTTVSNLNILNNGEELQGIFLKGVTNCLINNNNITSGGLSSFPIALNPHSDYNVISNNILKTSGVSLSGTTKSTCDIVLGGANYNTIKNNYMEVEDANAIYLSQYGSGSFEGGVSNYNIIFNNTIKCMIVPTSWCYGIQAMGSYNKIDSNTVIGTYRGISGNDNTNVTNNKLINLTGKNYATGELVGGDYGISAGANSVIAGNIFENCLLENAGIYVTDNGIIQNNNVNVKGIAYGINANGNNVKVIKNDVTTTTGACIYQAGRLSSLTVDNNNLKSNSGVGVLAVKTSSSKYPTAITISNNVISTTNQYAINVKDANKTSYTIKGNDVGDSKILSPNGEVEPEIDFNFNGTIYNIDPDSYHAFFDDNGNLININVKDGDILNFTGKFENKFPIISYSLKITGENPIFTDSKFKITSDSVWIENLTIINTNSSFLNPWGIFAKDIKKLMITNNDIFVCDKNAAYAIYLNDVTDANIINNNLSSSGDYLTFPVLFYGVEKSLIENNNILANGTSEIHGYEANKCLGSEACLDGEVCLDGSECLDGSHIVKEIYRTYGILLIYSSQNKVNSNHVVVTSKLNQTAPKINGSYSTNSIVGIDAYYDSNDNIFDGNDVLVYGNDNYMYGMGVLGAETNSGSSQFSQNNCFKNNNITIRGENVATGIISGYNTQNNNFTDNNIQVMANNSAYGITLEFGKDSIVSGNNISLTSDVSYGLEMFDGGNNIISENIIKTEGSYGFGIAAYNSNNNVIQSNQINVKGSGNKQINKTKHGDAITPGNSGVFFKSNSSGNLIENNEISSAKGPSINLSSVSNNKVINNYLKGENTTGNEAVIGVSNNIVENNYGYEFTNATVNNANSTYLGNATLIANSGIANDNKTTVKFYVNNVLVGTAITVNGKATLNANILENVGNYDIVAEFSRYDYKAINITAKLIISKGNLTVGLENASGKKGTSINLIATVKDAYGNIVKNMEVLFYRGNNYVGKATTNDEGVAKITWNIPSSISSQSDSIKASVAGNANYNAGEGLATVTYTNKTQTQIIIKDLELYYKNGTRLYATLADLTGKPIANASVIMEINGMPYDRTSNNEGKFSAAINLDPGKYLVSVLFAGNDKYYGSNGTAEVTVLSIIDSNNLELMFQNGSRFAVKALDKMGNPLANAFVEFNINGIIYNRTTKADGSCSIAINLAPDKYIVTTMFNGEMKSNNITVYSILIDNKELTKFYRNESQYTVRALDKHGNAIANATVFFNINGVIYNRTTNAEGIAKMNINLGTGKYIITAMYNNCLVSNNITVLSVIQSENLEMVASARKPFVVTILDGHGNPLSGAFFQMNINGIIYNRTTNASGCAKLNINLNPADYIITVMYNGLFQSNAISVKP